jgi:hypothetical protein
VNIMICKIVIVLAAVAAVTAGSASTAEARMSGGFGHGFHSGGGFHSFGGGFAHPGFHHFGHDRFFVHHRFGPRFGFFGGGYPYGYGDGCYTRVWSPWGWRWQYACY